MEIEIDGICELVPETPDPPATVAFYEAIGLSVLSREPGRVWLAAGERTRIGIWNPGEKEHRDRGGTHVHFALSVDRGVMDYLVAILDRGDVRFEGPVVHDRGDRSLYLFDPAGNRLELWDYFEDGDGAAAGVRALEPSDSPTGPGGGQP